MDFNAAKAAVVPVGRYRGQTLDDAAQTDEGLRWLDRAFGERHARRYPEFFAALEVYLGDPTIAKDVVALVRGR